MELQIEHALIARGDRTVLRDVSLRLRGGECVAILGRNGVGKSSLLLSLAGQLRPRSGALRLDGASLAALEPRSRARRIAFVDGLEPVSGTLCVRDAVAAARFAHHRWWEWNATPADDRAIDDALARVELTALAARELRTLSAGERQRVWIALALAQDAEIILLDEPTSHLDLRYAVETLALLRALAREGALVVAVLHSLEEAAAFCDRVILLGDERVLADGPPYAALTAETIEHAYGVAITVECRAEGLLFARRAPPDESR